MCQRYQDAKEFGRQLFNDSDLSLLIDCKASHTKLSDESDTSQTKSIVPQIGRYRVLHRS
jgi:hypothetical protein